MLPSPFQWVHTRIQRQGFPLVATEPGRNCGEGSLQSMLASRPATSLARAASFTPRGRTPRRGSAVPVFIWSFYEERTFSD